MAITSACNLGCARRVTVHDITGEWVARDAFFYMSIQNDSIATWGKPVNVFSWALVGKTSKAEWGRFGHVPLILPHPLERVAGLLFRHPFSLSDDGTLIVYTWPHDTLGSFHWRRDSLYFDTATDIEPIALIRLTYNPSIHLERISYSSALEEKASGTDEEVWPFTDCELEQGLARFVIRGGGRDSDGFYRSQIQAAQLTRVGEYYEAQLPAELWAQCQEIASTAFSGNVDRDSMHYPLSGLHRTQRERSEVRKWQEWLGELGMNALVLTVNGTKQAYLLPHNQFPPELAPLEPFINFRFQNFARYGSRRIEIQLAKQKIPIESRLLLLSSKEDSIEYTASFHNAESHSSRAYGSTR